MNYLRANLILICWNLKDGEDKHIYDLRIYELQLNFKIDDRRIKY
jgi:hypothetical protein